MNPITNAKIGFGRYSGFSLLFDNPGKHSLLRMGKDFLKIDCPVDTDSCLIFYKSLKDGLDELGLEELFAKFYFFPLPPCSYHVTVFDGLSQKNLKNEKKRLAPKYQLLLEDFLSTLPNALRQKNVFTPPLEAVHLVQANINITFEFDKLSNWGGNVLVARLMIPEGDRQSKNALARIEEERKELSRELKAMFYPFSDPGDETKARSRRYNPHVSLGYFGNAQRGNVANSHTRQWTEVLKGHMANRTITLTSISLYAFVDMATFFKQRPC
jgi:hypothetical protein